MKMKMKNAVLQYAPIWFQNLAISLFNYYQYLVRHSGSYKWYMELFQRADSMTQTELRETQSQMLEEFLAYTVNGSRWYRERLSGVKFEDMPLTEKKDIVDNLDLVKTIDESRAVVNYTGGTTGASLKVLYTKSDWQARHALIDHFRSSFGYRRGTSRVGWFSGKDIASKKDISRGICSRDDWFNKIRFFSTFHISPQNFDVYWKSLCDYNPEFLVGFPSSVYEICKIAKEKGVKYPYSVKVFFPTAETLTADHRSVIKEVLGCELVDQYSSSEGAPFILQCKEGKMHAHLLTGIFETLPLDEGKDGASELVVTSFFTSGTPLVKYRIGDKVKSIQEESACSCGSPFPVVEELEGRLTDFLWATDGGKVNLGNISNSTKEVDGIICFQVFQDSMDKVEVKVVCSDKFNERQESRFKAALHDRLGSDMAIQINLVDDLPRAPSGKFRIVRNLLTE